jgi:predicted nucleotidyltransferase
MDKSEIMSSVLAYADVVKKTVLPKKIILYGSYAEGNAQPESDIDIAVVFEKFEGSFLDTASLLYKMRRDIDDRIEPIILEESQDKSGFLEEIQKKGFVV